jgi:carbon monoxide dehydrogenase subunit G
MEVSHSITIDRPVSDVFAYLDDPENHVAITPSLAEVRNVQPLDNGGKRVEHTYRMASISLDGELEETTHHPDDRMVFKMRGDLSGEIEIEFSESPGGTTVTYSARYDLPGHVLATVAKPFVKRYNERELRLTLENLDSQLAPA